MGQAKAAIPMQWPTILALAPPLAHGGANGALVCPLRLGLPCASWRSRRASWWCAQGVRVHRAPCRPRRARSWPTEVRLRCGLYQGLPRCLLPKLGERARGWGRWRGATSLARERGGVACRGTQRPGGARSWPTEAALSRESRRLGPPVVARSPTDPSLGRGDVRPRGEPTPPPSDARFKSGGCRGGGGGTS